MNEPTNSERPRRHLTTLELVGVVVASVLLGASFMTLVSSTDSLPFGMLTFSGASLYLVIAALIKAGRP